MDAPDTYLIDSNIFLRVLVRENEKVWQETRHLIQMIEARRITAVTSPLVCAEVQWVLRSVYAQPKEVIASSLHGIINIKNLRLDHVPNTALAVALYEEHTIKFIDALLASDARVLHGSMGIISYDKEFDKIKGVVRREPKYFLKKTA